MDPELLLRLGVALGLGLLVGLQREHVRAEIAGIRTFALIALLGAVAGLVGDWAVAAGVVALAATLAAANYVLARDGAGDAGITTEVAALLLFLVGAAVVRGHVAAGMTVGAAVAVVLHGKERLHGFAGRLDERDLRAILQLVVIALVVLPVLPDRPFGPYGVLNPHEIWRMVVLIVAIGLGGYVAFRILGPRAGAVAGGLLGGLVSSTATTLSYARHTRETPDAARLSALVIVLASAVVYARILLEVAVVAPRFLPATLLPVGALLAAVSAIGVVLALRVRREDAHRPEHANPAELRAALAFAALYALVLLLVAWVRDRFGEGALYVASAASGLADLDAITLSTARLVAGGRLEPDLGWRLIVVASLANLVFKGAIAALVGGGALARAIAVPFALALAAGGLVLAFF